jgi:hypothetical protein
MTTSLLIFMRANIQLYYFFIFLYQLIRIDFILLYIVYRNDSMVKTKIWTWSSIRHLCLFLCNYWAICLGQIIDKQLFLLCSDSGDNHYREVIKIGTLWIWWKGMKYLTFFKHFCIIFTKFYAHVQKHTFVIQCLITYCPTDWILLVSWSIML